MSNIFYRMGSKLIGLNLSVFLYRLMNELILIRIALLPRFRKYLCDYWSIDNIISVMYCIVTMRLFKICWRLIWSCLVDLISLSFVMANVTSATCTGWGLLNEVFLLLNGTVLLASNPLVKCLCFTSLYVFSPIVYFFVCFLPYCFKKLLKVLALFVGLWKLHLYCFDFQGTSFFSAFQVS